MPNSDHNKIIRSAAKEVLVPIGVFQKGQSRIWIDDNGWFLILIEFQPSGWAKGAYLNIGIHFLWTRKDDMSFDYSLDQGARVHNHIEFTGDEAEFYAQMVKLSNIAVAQINQYRKLAEPQCAKKQLLNKRFFNEELWGNWHKSMLCFFNQDQKNGRKYFDRFSKVRCKYNHAINQFIKEQTQIFSSDGLAADDIKEKIIQVIKAQRQYCRQNGMKGLKNHILYD